MIEHLRGREQALASLGWTGREAEWIALVCLHSGVFTRPQFCHYFDAPRKRAHRIVKAILVERGGVESDVICQRRREDVPDFRQADLPGAWESRTSATGEKLTGASSCGGFSRLILSWNIRG